MSNINEAQLAAKLPPVEKDPRETHVFHVTVSKGHSKPEVRKAKIMSIHGKDHAIQTAIKHYEEQGYKVHDHKQVKESYDDNRTGFTKKKREDDEYHNEPKPKFKAKSTMDRPHTVHIDGKPWKKFDNGHQAHAAANTLKSKGKKAVAIAHFKEHIEEIDEARMSAAVKLQRAFQREQEKSARERKAGEDLLKKNEQPKKTNEASDICPVCGQTPCNCTTVELEEGIQIHPDRYIRSHGKKPSGGHGLWMFTHKHSGGVNYSDKSQVHSAQGNYSDAKKSAAKWAAEHGHKKVYVMEGSNAYEKAEENKKSADAAKKQGDMFAHHLHMADHHDNMAQWHGEKGRHGEADRHAEKSEKHHEEAMKLKEEVAANNVGGGNIAGTQGDAGKKAVMTKEPLKRKTFKQMSEECNCWKGYKRKPGTKPCEDDSCVKEESELDEGGLWANIHAKRKRIKNGSGERMRKPGEKGAPTAADFKAASESVEIDEAAVDAKGHKSSTGGLTQKGRDYYNNKTGGNLQAPVTTPPSKLDPDSKAAKRRKSFCARMSGVDGPMKDEKGRPTRKALALRKWNC